MMIELRALRHFVTLCELGTFARAAAALDLSQPALTRSIQSLERKIGAQLVLRSSAGTTPTDIGRVLALRAREVLQMAEDLGRDLQSKSAPHSGQVAVGAGPYPAETSLVPALTRFVKEFPLVKVRLQMRPWDELLTQLRSRELDFFVAEISTLLREPDLEIEPLGEHPLFFAVRSDHPLTRSLEFSLQDVFDYPFVSMSRAPPRVLQPMLSARRKAAGRSSPVRPFPAIDNVTLAALKRIVATSDAVMAVTLPCIDEDLEAGRLALLGSEPWLTLAYGVVALRGRHLNTVAARLIALIRDADSEVRSEEGRLLARWRPGTGAERSRPDIRSSGRRRQWRLE